MTCLRPLRLTARQYRWLQSRFYRHWVKMGILDSFEGPAPLYVEIGVTVVFGIPNIIFSAYFNSLVDEYERYHYLGYYQFRRGPFVDYRTGRTRYPSCDLPRT